MSRKLRIAVSAFFGLLTVAVCVLWVRSYWRADSTIQTLAFNRHVVITSVAGRYNVELLRAVNSNQSGRPFMPSARRIAAVPHWCAVLVACGMVVASWRVRRFSLRALLIATTLVAVVLGLAVWVAR